MEYLLKKCSMCGKEPQLWYDSEDEDSWFNIKCCSFHIHEPFRVKAFKEWNISKDGIISNKTKLYLLGEKYGNG